MSTQQVPPNTRVEFTATNLLAAFSVPSLRSAAAHAQP